MISKETNSSSTIVRDLIAGLVVFLVALPLCLGIAKASGDTVPLMSGLIAGIVGGVLVGMISGSHTSVSGPAAGLTAVIAAQLALVGSFEALLLAVFFAGIFQIGMGFFRMGSIADFVPTSVIKGLLAAIGLILILKQIPHLIGVDSDPDGEMSFIQPDHKNTFTELFSSFSEMHMGPLVVGLASLALLSLWDRMKFLKSQPIPSALLVVILGVVLGRFLSGFGGEWLISGNHLVSVKEVKSLSEASELITTPDFYAILNSRMWIAAITIALVASLETLLNIEAIDRLDPKKRVTPPNRELVAQGVGNMACGLIGGLPVTSVIIRSSVNINSGGQTRMSAVVHGILLVGTVLLVPWLLNMIPLSSLAAILLVTGYKLANPKLVLQMWKRGPDQFLPFIVTVLAIVFTDLLVGILIGLGFSLFFILRSNVQRPLQKIQERHLGGDVLRIELANQVSFLNRASLHKTLMQIPRGGHVLLDARKTIYLDHDVNEMIDDFDREIAAVHGVSVSKIGFRDHYDTEDKIQYVDHASRELQQLMTPDDVIGILMDGNERFRTGTQLSRDLGRQAVATAAGQFPLAVMLGCIDSRTPAEMVFDLGLGEIFSVRIAGNIAEERVVGSIEYGCAVAGAKLVVVVGHTSCGAVTSSVKLTRSNATAADLYNCANVDHLVAEIRQAIPDRNSIPDPDRVPDVFVEYVDNVARLNVLRTMIRLRESSPVLREMTTAGKIRLVGCMFNVNNGTAEFFDDKNNPILTKQLASQ